MGRHRLRYVVLGPRPKTWYDHRLRPLPETWELLYKTDYTELVGLRVRRLRQERGWTQAELASRIEHPRGGRYSDGVISRIEMGHANPPIYVYIHVAEALGVVPERLLGTDVADESVSEAEMTLVRSLQEARIAPHEALGRLVGRAG